MAGIAIQQGTREPALDSGSNDALGNRDFPSCVDIESKVALPYFEQQPSQNKFDKGSAHPSSGRPYEVTAIRRIMLKVSLFPELVKTRKVNEAVPSETLPNLAIPLLVGLRPSEVEDVLAKGRAWKVAPKTRVCTGGDKAEHLFVVLSGKVKYSRFTAKGDDVTLRLFTPGESFGLATLLPDPLNYLGTAEAVVAGELLVWNHDEISRLSDRYHQIKTNALCIALRLLKTVSDRHASLFEGNASYRIARALIDVGRRSGEIHPHGIDVHITNEQLGSLADVSRFTASRVLSGWNKTGVVTKERKTVRIHSPEGLLS